MSEKPETQKVNTEAPKPYQVKTKQRLPENMKYRSRQQFRKDKGGHNRKDDKFESRVIAVRRVSNVKAGGKRMRLSVMVVVGDKKGKIGVAIAKGAEVKTAQEKAIRKAKKKLIDVKLKGNTIPHQVTCKLGASKIFLKPAAPGTGVIAGSTVRSIVELAGVQDILTKVLGTTNPIVNTYCTIEALKRLKTTRL